ncbi:MAG: hypothetical protein AUI14_04680 [Actinobacteria bacterium 13_2_20CM_2_71_6]|nr:MAG: hypothetical protein AUI14_04680 [Actinobacteria bacterium 13_2_20CM_2_71_6]
MATDPRIRRLRGLPPGLLPATRKAVLKVALKAARAAARPEDSGGWREVLGSEDPQYVGLAFPALPQILVQLDEAGRPLDRLLLERTWYSA